MLRRLGFTGRLMAIVLLALLVLWAIGVGWVLVSESREEIASRLHPLPEQVAATVDLIEATESGRQSVLLRAVSSETLRVTIEKAPPKADRGFSRLPLVEQYMSRYLSELEPREVIAAVKSSGRPLWWELRLGWFWIDARQPLYLAVALRGGGYLQFEVRGQLSRRLFGLPPGFVVGALGALVAIAAIVAIAREARPLKMLADRVDDFSGATLPTPVPVVGAPEIRKLIEAINSMQARIVDLVRGRTLLLGAISHDLKTYLTRLRLRIEDLPVEEQRDKATRDLDDMTALLSDTLAVARGTFVSARREIIDVVAMLTALATDYANPCIRLRCSREAGPLLVEGDRIALRRLFANLLDNALRFGTTCEVRAARDSDRIAVTIDDDGPGIPESERTAVLVPFHRLEQSRSRDTGGSGLGLAIVQQIAEAHGGSIAIDAAPLGGVRASVTLPCTVQLQCPSRAIRITINDA